MSLPEESVAANTLPEVTTIPTGKKLIFTDPDTNEGGIITLENLTKQILQNLTSQTFALDQGNLTLLQALNQLNSKLKIYDMGQYYKSYTFTEFMKEKLNTGLCIISGYQEYTFSDLPENLNGAINIIAYKATTQSNGKYYQGIISDSTGNRYSFVLDDNFTTIIAKVF